MKENVVDYIALIKQSAKENRIDVNEVSEILKKAFLEAFRKQYDQDAELKFEIDWEKNTFKVTKTNMLVIDDENTTPLVEISLEEAKKIDENAKDGDEIAVEIDTTDFSKKVGQHIAQIFGFSTRERKKQEIYAANKSLIGEMVSAKVVSVGRTFANLELKDGSEAFMPPEFRNANIRLSPGEIVNVYVEDVLEDAKRAQIIVSNGSNATLKRLLESEVPELIDGTVEVVGISRVPGLRAKVAVKSNNPDVDPVGTIIGSNGSRIAKIIAELGGEKVDVIRFDEDKIKYVAASLSPARVIAVIEKKTMRGHYIVVSPDSQHTLAIGKAGSNAKLSVELTKSRLDIISEAQAKEQGVEYDRNQFLTDEEIATIESGRRLNNRTNRNNSNNNWNKVSIDESDFGTDFNSAMSVTDTVENSNVVKPNLDDFNLIGDRAEEIEEDIDEDFELDVDLDMADIDEDFM